MSRREILTSFTLQPAARAAGCALLLLAGIDLLATGFSPVPGRSPRGTPDPAFESPALLPDALAEAARLLRAGSYAEAAQVARQALVLEEISSGEPERIAALLDLLVEALWRNGLEPPPEAKTLAERSLDLRRGPLGNDELALARSLENLARVTFLQAEYPRALELHEQALGLRRRHLDPGHPDVARSLRGVAQGLLSLGKFKESRPLLERARAIQEQTLGDEDPELAETLEHTSDLLTFFGLMAQAEELQAQAFAIKLKAYGTNHPNLIVSKQRVAFFLRQNGDLAEARRLLENALESSEQAFGADSISAGAGASGLGLLLTDMGDYTAARELHARALRITRRVRPPGHYTIAFAQNNLAVVHWYQGHFDLARQLLQESIPVLSSTLGAESHAVGWTRTIHGIVLSDLGEPEAAMKEFEQALPIMERTTGPRSFSTGLTLTHYAEQLRRIGDYRRAERYAARALRVREAVSGPEHPDVAETLNTLAKIAWATGRIEDALSSSIKAESIYRNYLRSASRYLSEEEALRLETMRVSGLDVALTAVASAGSATSGAAIGRVWDGVVRSRSLVLDEMAARHRLLLSTDDPEVIELRRLLDAARRRLAGYALQGGADKPGALSRLAAARHDAARLERRLAASSSDFRRSAARNHSGLEEIRKSLPSGSALVAFVRYNRLTPFRGRFPISGGASVPVPSYLAFIQLSDDTEPIALPIGTTEHLDSLVREWRNMLAADATVTGTLRDGRAAGEALRRLLWDPIARRVRGERLVFVVPDGTVNRVSLAALPDGAQSYLLETGHLFHYLSAERDLVEMEVSGRQGSGALVLGGPDFDGAPAPPRGKPETVAASSHPASGSAAASTFRSSSADCRMALPSRFAPLPNARAEVDEIARLLETASPADASFDREVLKLTDRAAAEESFRRFAPGRRILHLATHGFSLAEGCDPESEGASPRSRSSLVAAVEAAPGRSPLLLTGLALAGANRRIGKLDLPQEDDGILTAEEIASLDLRGVQWAVLLGCETGGGSILSGEGVLGLRRAFEVAGAETVIMSLWPVRDVQVREWSRHLYEARSAGLSTAEVMRAAGMRMIAARRQRGLPADPSTWGAFVAVGDWR